MRDVTVYELEDALRRQVIAIDPGETVTKGNPEEGERTEAMAAFPAQAARDLLDAIAVARGDDEPAEPADNEIAALTVIVDRLEHLQPPTVQRVIRYLCDRYGTDG